MEENKRGGAEERAECEKLRAECDAVFSEMQGENGIFKKMADSIESMRRLAKESGLKVTDAK